MTDDLPDGKQPEDNPPQTALEVDKKQDEKLEALLDRVPADQIQTVVREVIFGIINRESGPKLDPEVIRIAAATLEKDQENKFRYLTQKEENAAI